MVSKRDTISYYCSLKSVFVENQLIALCRTINTDVQSLRYEYSANDYDVENEWVIILFRNGFDKRVNVTCDSYKQLTEDVLKKI